MSEITADAINAIANLKGAQSNIYDVYRKKVVVIGTEFKEYDDSKEPTPDPIKLSTLAGVADYIKSEIVKEIRLVVTVDSPVLVQIISPVHGGQRQKLVFVNSVPGVPQLPFGQYRSVADTIITLKTGFAQSAERDAVIAALGKISTNDSVEIDDDGVSQSIQAKSTISRRGGDVTLGKAVDLEPFRTFAEIPQPSSPFILRIQKDSDGVPKIAIFEADGGAWRTEAISRIGEWLKDKLAAEEGDGTIVPVLA